MIILLGTCIIGFIVINVLTFYAVGLLWKVANNMQDIVLTDDPIKIQEPSAKYIVTSYVLRVVACVVAVVGTWLSLNLLIVIFTIEIQSLR